MTPLKFINHRLILFFLVLIGFCLRFYGIDKFGIAGDEKYSLFVSQFISYQGNNQKDSVRKPDSPYFTAKEFWSEKELADFYDSIARVDTGNGAFFTYSLHWWTGIFGNSDASLRFLPLLFTLGLILLIYKFVLSHFKNANLALLSAALATFSPLYISYAQVARNYAILFFFALLATHYFLKLLQSEFRSKNWWIYLSIYGVSAAVCELNHLSTLTLFFLHFVYLLIFYRNWSSFIGYCFAMVFPFLAVVFWILSPGGAYIFEYVSNSVRVYNEMAEQNPYEFLSKTSVSSVVLQIRHIISAMFINIDGFYDGVNGKKNGLLALSLFLVCSIVFKLRISSWLKHGFAALSIIALLFFTKWQQIFLPVFIMNTGILIIAVVDYFKTSEKPIDKTLLFISALSTLPILFLVVFAIQDGNTFRIFIRYVAYAYAFALMFVAFFYSHLAAKSFEWKPWFIFAIVCQLIQIGSLISKIYEDKQPRYFSNYAEPRAANPYPLIADKIVNMAALGDTIVYPTDEIVHDDRQKIISVIDAQMTNFYLPKENEILQRVDEKERNKVFLIKQNGKKIELFDFKGTKYRY